MKTLLFIPLLFMCSMVIGQSSKIIGKTITIGSLEVAQFDFPDKDGFPKIMTWNEAKKACTNLGSGWRLPTKDELNLLYKNKDKFGSFNSETMDGYWSSTEDSIYFEVGGYGAWAQFFEDGSQESLGKTSILYVRAVRSF